MTAQDKKIGLNCIKYAPTVLALTCSVKILLLTMSQAEKDVCLYAVNYINLALNIAILLAVFILGRCFGYCWKHRSLCRVTFWGYLYYGYFLVARVPKEDVFGITIFYVVAVVIFTLLYREAK